MNNWIKTAEESIGSERIGEKVWIIEISWYIEFPIGRRNREVSSSHSYTHCIRRKITWS